MNSVERFLTALEGRQPDRVPYYEMGMDPYTLAQFLVRQDYWPNRLKNWVDKSRLYEEIVQASREKLNLAPSKSKTILRKVLNLDAIAGSFLEQPTSYKFAYFALKNYLSTIFRLDVDGTNIFGLPGPIMRGWTTKKGKRYLVNEGYILHDIDEWANIRIAGVYYPDPETQMEKYIESMQNYDFAGSMPFLEKLRNKFGEKKLLIPGIMGLFETWHEIFGITNMSQFFRVMRKEAKTNSGPYLNVLDELVNFVSIFVEHIAEIGLPVIMIYEDCCVNHGPMIPAELYRKIYTPRLKKLVDASHKHDVKVIFHTDGRMKIARKDKPWDFMDAIVESGIDAMHGFQADVNDPFEIKKQYGHKLCIVGGISCYNVAQYAKTSQEVYRMVARVMKAYKEGGGYVAACDNGLHWGVNVKNVRAISKAIHYYGKY